MRQQEKRSEVFFSSAKIIKIKYLYRKIINFRHKTSNLIAFFGCFLCANDQHWGILGIFIEKFFASEMLNNLARQTFLLCDGLGWLNRREW
jgi:hypothetical protein